MTQPTSDVLLLDDNQPTPHSLKTPPRKPQWTDTFAYVADPDRFCRDNLEKYGPIFKTGVFGGTTVFVGDPQAVQMALNGDSRYTELSLPATTMTMFGEYSLFQRPDLHRQRKSALQPAFMGRMLAGYIPHMHQTIDRHLQSWSTDRPIPLVPSVEAVSFEILVPLLLGVNLEDPQAFVGLPLGSQTELKQLYQTFFNGFYGLLKWRSPLTAFGRGMQARDKLQHFMRAVIQQKRSSTELIDPGANFLAMMLASQQENPEGVFSDNFIENQCLLQLWGAHYEVMGLLSSWMYLVGQHPAVVDRLRSEQADLLDDRSPADLNAEHLKQLTYLEATIKETLRLLPPTPTATRKLTRSVVVDGVLYQKGWSVVAEPRIAHKLTAAFTDPDRFDPERFLPDRAEGKPYEFIPFGGGVHACLGAQLAMTIAKLFGSHLLHQFNWQLPGDAKFIQFPIKRIQDDYTMQLAAP